VASHQPCPEGVHSLTIPLTQELFLWQQKTVTQLTLNFFYWKIYICFQKCCLLQEPNLPLLYNQFDVTFNQPTKEEQGTIAVDKVLKTVNIYNTMCYETQLPPYEANSRGGHHRQNSKFTAPI
jgi:hypothetical protein